VYDLNDDDIVEQVRSLPSDARRVFEELCTVVALVPWQSEPAAHDNPDGQVRFVSFTTTAGSGFVYFLILEDEHRVDLLELIWIG